MLSNRILAALAVAFVLAVGLAASTNKPSFKTRWNNTVHDLAEAPPSNIPEDKLRARGEEILRERLVAKDD